VRGADGHIQNFIAIKQDVSERKRAEEALKSSHSLLTATLESTADGILAMDNTGKVTGFNRRFLEMWRIPETLAETRDDEKLLQFVMDQLCQPEVFLGQVHSLYTTPEATFEDELVFKDGRFFERYSRPQWIGIAVVGRGWSFSDITERKRAEESLRRSQQEFKDMFDNAPVGFHEIDAEGRLVRINNTELRMLGYSAGELLGQFVWKISAEEETSRRAALAKLKGEPPPSAGFERKFRRKDGSIFPVLICDQILKREDGVVTGIRASVQDITGEKQIEQVLARERDLLRALMDHLPDYIYFKDVNSRFIRINRAHARHFGLPKPEDATGKSDADFFSAMEARQKLVDEQCLLATGNPILGLVEITDRVEGTRWVSSTKVPIYGADGKITGLVGISRDITASKQAELEWQAMEAQLRQSQKWESIGQLAAGIAHEINTPTQYRLITAEKELLNKTLSGSIKLLTDMLSMIEPQSFGREQTMRNLIGSVTKKFPTGNAWEIPLAFMLAPIANATLPPELLVRARAGGILFKVEEQIMSELPETAARLLANVPRLEGVARIVRYSQKHYDGAGAPPDAVKGEALPELAAGDGCATRTVSRPLCAPRATFSFCAGGNSATLTPCRFQSSTSPRCANGKAPPGPRARPRPRSSAASARESPGAPANSHARTI
jgi:PAS domain S-box-containing protein